MMKLNNLFENFDLAKHALGLYDHDESNLDRLLSYFRISSNAVYPYRNDGSLCFLRLAPLDEKNPCDVASEIRIIQYLRQKGFNAMEPIAMKDGSFSRTIDTQWGTYTVSSFRAVRGEALDDCDPDMDVIRLYGRSLAQMHSLLAEYPDRSSRKDHRGFMDDVLSNLKTYGASNAVMKEFSEVSALLETLPITAGNYGLVHYDYEVDNVFYDDESNDIYVIDFDDSICCWYVLDVVRAIDSLIDAVEESALKAASEAFLEGYDSVHPLTDQELSMMEPMRRLVRLQEYATLKRVLSVKIEDQPDWMDEIVEKSIATIESIEKALG